MAGKETRSKETREEVAPPQEPHPDTSATWETNEEKTEAERLAKDPLLNPPAEPIAMPSSPPGALVPGAATRQQEESD